MAGVALMAGEPGPRDVKTVYILRMANGLDQFLASEITKKGLYTVTTEPDSADAVFTDSLGEGFEKKLDLLYPPEAPPPVPAAEDKAKDAVTDPAPMQRLGNSSWGRGKGTIFLIDRKSRQVVWSMNRQPKNSSTNEMVEQARKVTRQLQKDIAPPAAK